MTKSLAEYSERELQQELLQRGWEAVEESYSDLSDDIMAETLEYHGYRVEYGRMSDDALDHEIEDDEMIRDAAWQFSRANKTNKIEGLIALERAIPSLKGIVQLFEKENLS